MHRAIIPLIGALLVVAAPAAAQEPFADVDPDAYYADSVGWMISEGLTTGSGEGLYRPDDAVTRGETAVFLWRLMGEPAAPVHPFGDVTVGWQDDAIAWMRHADISQGVSPTRFDPFGTVSRGALATFLWRAAGEPSAPPHGFADVADPELHAPVSWVLATGISTGLAPGAFAPGEPVSRGQIAVFLERFAGELPASAPDVAPDEQLGDEGDAGTASDAELRVSPPTLRVGERLRIDGSGFDGEVLLALDDEVVAHVSPGPDGSFSTETRVPEGPDGVVSVVAIQGGVAVASVGLVVREASPTIGWWFPLLVILLVLGAVGVWWRRQQQASAVVSVPDLPQDSITLPTNIEPAPSEHAEDRAGAIEVTPLGIGTIGPVATLSTHGDRLWGTARAGFEGIEHAIVVALEGPGTEWQVLADLGPGVVDAVVVSGRDAIAVGSRHVANTGAQRLPTLWHTPDLSSWLQVDLVGAEFAEAMFDGVAALGEALVLHGRSAVGPAIWIGSTTGWSTIPVAGPIDCMAVTDKGMLAFGRDLERRTTMLLASQDSVGLTPVEHPSVAVFDAATILSVVDFQGGLVAAGFDNMRGTAAVFVSDDGLQWHRAPVEFSEGTGIETLIAYDDLLIAIGSSRRRGSAARKSDLALWMSSDAVTWEPVDPGRVGTSSRAVAAIGLEGGIVISGVRSVDSDLAETPVIWRFDPRELLAPAS